jgi:hypothetical protein
MPDNSRRRLAIGLALAAPVVVTTAMLANANQDYVYARLLNHTHTAVGLAALMLAVAARLVIARRALRITAYVATGLVSLSAWGLGIGLYLAGKGLGGGPAERGTVATSAAFQAVAYEEPVVFRSNVLVLRIRTRAGSLSREGTEVACFMAPGTGVGPEWLLGHARFSAYDQLEISTVDGTIRTLTFDTHTLNVSTELDRCSQAPDPRAD